MDNNHWWLLAFGMSGGLLRHLREKFKAGGEMWKTPGFYRDLFLELATSAFATWAVYNLCLGMGWENQVAVAFAGMAGYMGGSAIEILTRMFEARAR